MRFTPIASHLLAAMAASVAAVANETVSPSSVVPGRFIVELADADAVIRAVEIVGGSDSSLRVFKTFNSSVFKGISIECKASSTECEPEKLRSLFETESRTVVRTVRPATRMRLIEPVESGDVETFADDGAAAKYSVHGLTGVEKLHAAGIYGEGVTVAIVDSGVQYTHPALGGGIGQGYTVIGGCDLINDDDDPMDDYGHGTHVAGIIAGNSSQFTGVAPAAKLLSYKTLGSDGYSDEELSIEGFLRAFEDGADIITASIGEVGGFTSNTWAEIASRMVDEGTIVTIAAGNAGVDGPFLMSNGASGRNVLTVASSEPDQMPARPFSVKLGTNESAIEMAYMPGGNLFPETIVGWPVVATSLDSTIIDDACDPLPDNFGNLTGKIALVRLGGCSIYDKHENLVPFSPEYILFYSAADVYTSANTGVTPGLTGAIEAAAGESIVSILAAGGNVTLSFDLPSTPYVGLSNSNGAGRPARYSTWGSTFDMALKPDVSGPGSQILSTYPTDGYRVLSGTSMSTPYIAGVAALLVSQLGSGRTGNPAKAKQIEARIMASAHSAKWADWSTSVTDYGFLAPSTQVGAGFVDAYAALNTVTEVVFEDRKFELNDTAHFQAEHTLTLRNTGSEAVTYGFVLEPAGGYEPWEPVPEGEENPGYGIPGMKLYPDIAPMEMVPGVTLPDNVTLAAGEEKEFGFVFGTPKGLDASTLPVYSGKVFVSASNGEEISIPYFGIAADLQEEIQTVWDTGALYPSMVSGTTDISLENKANFTFNLSMSSQDFPQLWTQFSWGTEEMRWDIFEANYTEAQWAYPPVPGQNGFVGSATSWAGTDHSSWFNPEEDDEDDIFPFPVYDQPRSSRSIYFWLGRYADGSEVVPGNYQFRIAALAPLGDPTVAAHWDIWDTPMVKFL